MVWQEGGSLGWWYQDDNPGGMVCFLWFFTDIETKSGTAKAERLLFWEFSFEKWKVLVNNIGV